MRRLAAIGLVAALACVFAAVALAADTARPDGEVKRKGKNFKGAEVVSDSSDGQRAGAKVRQGGKAVFIFRYRNATFTETADDITSAAACSRDNFIVTYKAEGTDVTSEVDGGTLVFENVAPDELTPKVKATVKVAEDAPDGFVGSTVRRRLGGRQPGRARPARLEGQGQVDPLRLRARLAGIQAGQRT